MIPPLARFPEEWEEAAVRLGGRKFHGKQIFKWIHSRGVTDAKQMSDLPAALRTRLEEEEGLGGVLEVVTERRATDDTRKLLVALGDGANVETVLIPRVAGGPALPSPVDDALDADAAAAVEDEDDPLPDDGPIPVTQCISTQVGCAMGCVFCASGVAGLKRHMRADEIVAQVLAGRARLDPREQLRNVVMMGMGEP